MNNSASNGGIFKVYSKSSFVFDFSYISNMKIINNHAENYGGCF